MHQLIHRTCILQATLEAGSEDGMNLVAFGGGMAATLAAFLVHSVFEVRESGVLVLQAVVVMVTVACQSS